MTKKTRIVIYSIVVFVFFLLPVLILITRGPVIHYYMPASPSDDKLSPVDKILDRLELGNIAFNAPQHMNIEDKKMITVLLSAITPIDELKKELEAEGEKIGASIRISDRMEARLSGQHFSITAITPEVQAISRKQNTEWKWEVVPKKHGNQALHLTLSVLILVDGTPTPRAIRTFDTTINVEVTNFQKIKLFVKANWQWLWTALLIPIVGWLWKKRKKCKTSQHL